MELVKKTEAKPETLPVPVSPELQALRQEANTWVQIMSIIGDATVKARECQQAKVLLDRLEICVQKAIADVEAQVAKEEAAKPKPPEAPPAPVIPDKAG